MQKGTKTDALGRIFPSGAVFDPATSRTVTAGQLDPVSGIVATTGGQVRDPFYQGSVTGITNFTGPVTEGLLNQIPAGRLNPAAVALLKLYPLPQLSALTNNYTSNPAATTNIDSTDVRLDQIFGSKDSAFVRYSFVYNKQFQTSRPLPGVAYARRPAPGRGTASRKT